MYYTEVKKDGLPKKDNEEKLKVHSDGPNKFLTSLMYFKNKSDKSENMGGDLAIHYWRFPLPFFLKKIILAKNNNFINSIIRYFQFIFIGVSKKITYEPNKFVMFLGSIDSLHSVTSRKKGSPIRRLPDVTKIKKIGFKPKYEFEKSLGHTVDWYWNYFNKKKK